MRNAVMAAIRKAARKDPKIYLLSGDYGKAFMDLFQKEAPGRVLNCGMAEQNMIGVAAGLALTGAKVFVYSIVPFVTLRVLEQLKLDVAYPCLDVTIVGTGAGFVYGTCGPTHVSIEDIGCMRTLPNMKVVCPANPMEAEELTDQIVATGGPTYLRLNKANEVNPKKSYQVVLGEAFVAKDGSDITLVSTGALLDEVLLAAATLEALGFSTEVLHMHTVKPLDEEAIRVRVKSRRAIFSIEEHSVIGGLGSAVAEVLAESGSGIVFKRFGIQDAWPAVIGTQAFLREWCGISSEKLVPRITALLE